MNRPPQGHFQSGVGATFYPGGEDDFYIPELISPAPQRVMPEVPENMQDNIAHLEREARFHRPSIQSSQQSPAYERPQFPHRTSSSQPQSQPQSASYQEPYSYNQYTPNNPDENGYGGPNNLYGHHSSYDDIEEPNFSPFPALKNPPPNVPPTDEQREANLESARSSVLSSNDPEMQLAWAQDALSYVEVAMQNELRLSQIQPPRSQTPQIERQLRTDAINITSFLADQHHPKAVFMKGMWLEFGKFGFRVDKKEAFRCYARAAERGYARAEYRIGMQFESSNEPAKAIRHYEKGVQLHDSASYYRLGMMILLGQHGQRQDYHKGLEYIHLAAQGCDENAPQGAYVYGMLLAHELPQVTIPDHYLPFDLNGARVNIEKAAYHGFAKAQVKMGAAYELCQLGCDFNPALSLHYNLLAAHQGEADAEMAISKWFLCGHEGVFEKNDEIAFTYAQRAAQSGLPTAEFALGYFYEVGIYVSSDLKQAREWYSKAAANGNKDAAGRIDSISRSKTLSRKDHERVAIARIKSQYGSHGQGRPPVRDTLEMPDASRMRISDDNPATHRAASAAPYPEASHLGPPQHYSPEIRPSSAFGINPRLQSNPSAYSGPPPVPHPQQRIPSGPAVPGYRQGGGMGMPSPQPSPGSNGPPTSNPGTPRLDIGYSAPIEQPGRRRLQRPDGPPGTMGRPAPPQDMGHAIPPDRRPPARSPVPGGRGRLPTGGQYPPRQDSAPPPGRGSASSTPRPSGPPSQPPQNQAPGRPQGASKPPQSAPATQNKPAQSKPTQSQPAAKPQKGPKTFEEMGVPQGKNDSDCVVM